MAKYGLRLKPTFNSIIDYLEEKQPIIKYPDVKATVLMDTAQMSQFLGDGAATIDLQKQQENILKGQILKMQLDGSEMIQKESMRRKRASVFGESNASTPVFSNASDYMDYQDALDWTEEEQRLLDAARKTRLVSQSVDELSSVSSQSLKSLPSSVRPSTPSSLPPLEEIEYPPEVFRMDTQEEEKPDLRQTTPTKLLPSASPFLSSYPRKEEPTSSPPKKKPPFPAGLRGEEAVLPQASSSSGSRARSTSRPGTRRETDYPEGLPKTVLTTISDYDNTKTKSHWVAQRKEYILAELQKRDNKTDYSGFKKEQLVDSVMTMVSKNKWDK